MNLTKCKVCGKEISKNAKLCPHCGEPLRKRSLFALSLAIGFVAISLSYLVIVSWVTFGDTLPECNSSNAKRTLTEAINRAQFFRSFNLEVVEVRMIKEAGYVKNNNRICSADIYLNNSNTMPIKYKMESRNDSQYLLTFEVFK